MCHNRLNIDRNENFAIRGRIDELARLLHEHFENNKKRDEVLLSNAETVNKILKEITGSWSDKTTFHGKAIKKGGSNCL